MFDFRYAWELLPALLAGLLVTAQATLLGMSFAVLVGLGWAILRRSPHRWIALPTRELIEFLRGTPLLVQIYFLYYVLPSFGVRFSPLTTGVVAIGLHYSAYIAEVYRAGIESVPTGQWEAAAALNLSNTRTWIGIILPQAVPPMTPALGNYLIAMFKDTPILSAVTVLELLNVAKIEGSQSFRYLEPMTMVGVLFLAVSLAASAGVKRLERRFASKERRL